MKVAIIDDQQQFLDKYSQKLKNIEDLEIETFLSVKDFEKKTNHVDFLLLDIDMPECDGIEYAQLHKNINIVFLTSHGDRIKDAFGTNIYGFIEKSDSHDYFINKIKDIIAQINHEDYVQLKMNDSLFQLKKKDIIYAQYIHFKTIGIVYQSQQFIIKGYTLKAFQDLIGNMMIYSDKGTLINQDKILEIIGDVIYLEGISQTFQISRRRIKDFQNIVLRR